MVGCGRLCKAVWLWVNESGTDPSFHNTDRPEAIEFCII